MQYIAFRCTWPKLYLKAALTQSTHNNTVPANRIKSNQKSPEICLKMNMACPTTKCSLISGILMMLVCLVYRLRTASNTHYEVWRQYDLTTCCELHDDGAERILPYMPLEKQYKAFAANIAMHSLDTQTNNIILKSIFEKPAVHTTYTQQLCELNAGAEITKLISSESFRIARFPHILEAVLQHESIEYLTNSLF